MFHVAAIPQRTLHSAFATRQVLYKRWFGGDNFRNAIILYDLDNRKPMTRWVHDFLEHEYIPGDERQGAAGD